MYCKSCQVACAIEHSDSKNVFTAVNEFPKPVTRLQLKKNESTVKIEKCHHCVSPPCIKKCPAQALYIDPESNNVMIDYSKCRQCGACIKECRYKAFVKIGNIILKCDGCIDRIKRGEKPACVSACHTGSLSFSD